MIQTGASNKWTSVVSRGALFSLIWWILSDGNAHAWWLGAPAILLALIVSLALIPNTNLVWREVIRFMPFFVIRSLLGGVDVAWRALHPRRPIRPDIVEYQLRLPSGMPQVLMANVTNLLPGTLCASIDQGALRIHVLDSRKNVNDELEKIELHVARLFGISLRGIVDRRRTK